LVEAGQRFEFGKRLDQLRRYQVAGGLMWPYFNEGRDRYQDSSRESIGVAYPLERHRLKGVGGSTLHWGALIDRLRPTDFQTASTYGIGIDWPLTYDELEPFYSRAEWEIGVSGTTHALHPPRSRDYPMPAFPLSPGDATWVAVTQRLGIEVYPCAHAINNKPYAGRSECLAYAACAGCPSGARYSADFHVKAAEESGLCTLLSETVARRIDLNGAGEVTRIRATTLAGRDVEITARDYVICAHAVESARLLLLSNCGNQSDQVGRNFMEHILVGAGGWHPHHRFYPSRIGFERLESVAFYDGPRRHQQQGGIKLSFGFERDPLSAIDQNVWGPQLARLDAERFGRWMEIEAQTEQQPNADSRITLDPEVKDAFGDPVPHVRLAFSDICRRTQTEGRGIIERLLKEVGLPKIAHSWMTFGSHHMGTCRMADDPRQGVVDRNCKVHGTSNLHVLGASVFPTSGALQPTLTVAALSLRFADHLLGPPT
jgi:choline dehydrogenase-like flavoprotein